MRLFALSKGSDFCPLRARRAGVLRVDISPTGARWYQLIPGHGLKRVLEALRAAS